MLRKAMRIIDKPTDEFQIFGDFIASEIRNLLTREQLQLKHIMQKALRIHRT